ncbi:MAG: sulfatase-like hydrolase/transferase, partial [Verrucomicrobiota bacterium]
MNKLLSPEAIVSPIREAHWRHPVWLLMYCVAWVGCLASLQADDRPPNIVFFFADDQTTSTLGCYGHPFVQTPNIDALAARGTRFSQALVSHSICWVSRTTILSGLTGRSYGTPGQRDLARPEAVKELYPDLLKKNGYRTGFFGKWHAKMPQGYQAKDHFDVYRPVGRNPFYKKQPDGSLRHETDLIVDHAIA